MNSKVPLLIYFSKIVTNCLLFIHMKSVTIVFTYTGFATYLVNIAPQ